MNDAYESQKRKSSQVGPAAKRMRLKLDLYLRGLDTGRLQLKWMNALRPQAPPARFSGYAGFRDFDLQKTYPIEKMLKGGYATEYKAGVIKVKIPIGPDFIACHNRLVTGYFFELVVLWGNPFAKNKLRVEDVVSSLYLHGDDEDGMSELQLVLPGDDQPWMVFLKVTSLEGDQPAVHPRHYGMKVVGVN